MANGDDGNGMNELRAEVGQVRADLKALDDRVGSLSGRVDNLGERVDRLGEAQTRGFTQVIEAIHFMHTDLSQRIDNVHLGPRRRS